MGSRISKITAMNEIVATKICGEPHAARQTAPTRVEDCVWGAIAGVLAASEFVSPDENTVGRIGLILVAAVAGGRISVNVRRAAALRALSDGELDVIAAGLDAGGTPATGFFVPGRTRAIVVDEMLRRAERPSRKGRYQSANDRQLS